MVIKNLKYLIMVLLFVNPIFAMHDEKYSIEVLEAYQLGLFSKEIYINALDRVKYDVFCDVFRRPVTKFMDVIKKLREVKEFENTIIKIPYYLDALLIKVSNVDNLNEYFGWYRCNEEFYELNKKHSAKMEKLDDKCVKLIFNGPKNIYELQQEYKKALNNHRDAIVELVKTNFKYDENTRFIYNLDTYICFGCIWYFHIQAPTGAHDCIKYRLEYNLYENRFTKCVDENAEYWARKLNKEEERHHSPDCAYCKTWS